MLDLARADAEGERAQPAMAGGVAIAAHDCRTGKRKALFGADDMDDPLLRGSRAEIGHAEFGSITLKRGKLLAAFDILDRNAVTLGIDARGRRQVVIGHSQRQLGPADLAAVQPQCLEGLRAGHFMDQVAVDKHQGRAVLAALHHMGVPDLLV